MKGSKIRRRLPIGQAYSELKWLILSLRPPLELTWPHLTSKWVGLIFSAVWPFEKLSRLQITVKLSKRLIWSNLSFRNWNLRKLWNFKFLDFFSPCKSVIVIEKYFQRIFFHLKIKFLDIEGRDEGSKIRRRLPIGQFHFKVNWLILSLRPPLDVTWPHLTPLDAKLPQADFLSRMTVCEALETSNQRKNI